MLAFHLDGAPVEFGQHLGDTIGCEPDVSWLEVTMDDSLGVGELQTSAGLPRNGDGLLQGQPSTLGILQQTLHVPPPMSSVTMKG